jgi:putative SOS response-associated peptidase YedK
MCGRYVLKAKPADLIKIFGLDECVDLKPRYNIPPGTDIAAIRQSPEGKRVLHSLRWGLVPNWAKDPSIGNKLNNARGETVAEKPSFRDAFKRRRCLIPADGFYEWVRPASRMCDCLAEPSDQTCRPIGSTLRGMADSATNRLEALGQCTFHRKVAIRSARGRWRCQHRGGYGLG